MCGDPCGARVLFTDARHDAPFGDKEELPEIETLRTKDGGNDDILPCDEPSVGPKFHASAQSVFTQGRVGLHQSEFPREPRVLHRPECRRARPAVSSGDVDDVRARFDDADGDRTDAVPGHELHAHRGGRMHLLQLVDQLLQVFYAVDVVKGGRGNKVHVRQRMPRARDIPVHLHAHELSPFTGLRSLCDLDLQLSSRHQVPCGHTEPGRCNLFRIGGDPLLFVEGVLSPLPAIAPPSKLPHGEYDVPLAFSAHRTERHRP